MDRTKVLGLIFLVLAALSLVGLGFQINYNIHLRAAVSHEKVSDIACGQEADWYAKANVDQANYWESALTNYADPAYDPDVDPNLTAFKHDLDEAKKYASACTTDHAKDSIPSVVQKSS